MDEFNLLKFKGWKKSHTSYQYSDQHRYLNKKTKANCSSSKSKAEKKKRYCYKPACITVSVTKIKDPVQHSQSKVQLLTCSENLTPPSLSLLWGSVILASHIRTQMITSVSTNKIENFTMTTEGRQTLVLSMCPQYGQHAGLNPPFGKYSTVTSRIVSSVL